MSVEKQQDIMSRLQLKLLTRWERLLDSGELSPTDAATLTRFLTQNGWSLDPSHLPKGLQDKVRTSPSFNSDPDADEVWGEHNA